MISCCVANNNTHSDDHGYSSSSEDHAYSSSNDNDNDKESMQYTWLEYNLYPDPVSEQEVWGDTKSTTVYNRL